MTDYSTYSTETLLSLYKSYSQRDDYSSYCAAQAIRKELNGRQS